MRNGGCAPTADRHRACFATGQDVAVSRCPQFHVIPPRYSPNQSSLGLLLGKVVVMSVTEGTNFHGVRRAWYPASVASVPKPRRGASRATGHSRPSKRRGGITKSSIRPSHPL